MDIFLTNLNSVIRAYNQYIGEYLIVLILIPTGIYFAFKFKFLHITKLIHSFNVIRGKFDKPGDTGDINHFKALTTALSATIGTGNIVGVALAIYWGGPGAVFWMWITGFLGMILKFVECTLSLKYRKQNKDGSVSGGPMYYMQYALKDKLGKASKYMAVIFALAAVLCSLGTGNMAQSNSISDALHTHYQIPLWVSGSVLAVLVLLVIVGGIRRIADVTSKLVPLMALLYVGSSLTIILIMWKQVPGALLSIITDAFTGTAATGGFAGSAFLITIKFGVMRGLFSNEAGQGSAAIAHAAAKTEHPVREGLVASVGPLIDTLVICTMTALVIILTGAWKSGIEGVGMTLSGFNTGLEKIGLGSIAEHIVIAGLIMFAFSTIIAWSYYGTRAVQYLLSDKYIQPYRYMFCIFVFLGSIGKIDLVWNFVDMVITFMSIPNLIALILLSGIVKKEVQKYFSYMKEKKNIHFTD